MLFFPKILRSICLFNLVINLFFISNSFSGDPSPESITFAKSLYTLFYKPRYSDEFVKITELRKNTIIQLASWLEEIEDFKSIRGGPFITDPSRLSDSELLKIKDKIISKLKVPNAIDSNQLILLTSDWHPLVEIHWKEYSEVSNEIHKNIIKGLGSIENLFWID